MWELGPHPTPPHPPPPPPPRERQALGVLVGFPVGHELNGEKCLQFPQGKTTTFAPRFTYMILQFQARNQDFMWGGGGGANEAKVDQITERYFLLSDPFI